MQQKNAPIITVQTPPVAGPRTYVVIGVPRGGTSMVSGVIAQLGIDMGGIDNGRWEDDALNLALLRKRGKDLPDLVETLQARNAACPVWGWKDPLGATYLDAIWEHLRNPVLVVVFRDAVSAGGWALEKDRDPMRFVRRSVEQQAANLSLVERTGVPAALVSYERAIQAPNRFIDEMAGFLGVAPPADKAALRRFMEPGSYKPPGTVAGKVAGKAGTADSAPAPEAGG